MPLVAVPEHEGHLLRGRGENSHWRLSSVFFHPVNVEGLEVFGRGLDRIRTDDAPEKVKVGIADGCIVVDPPVENNMEEQVKVAVRRW